MLLKASLTPIYSIKEGILCAKAGLLLCGPSLKLYALEGTIGRKIAIGVDVSLSFTGWLINLIIGVLNARSFCFPVIVREWIVRKIADVVKSDV